MLKTDIKEIYSQFEFEASLSENTILQKFKGLNVKVNKDEKCKIYLCILLKMM